MNSNTHPLIQGMRQAGTINPYFELPISHPGQQGWIDAESLFLEDGPRLRRLVRSYGQAFWGSDNPHVAGSAFIIAYLTRLVWPVIALWVREGLVPDVSLPNIRFHQRGEGIDATALRQTTFAAIKGSPAARHQDSAVAADAAELYLQMKRWLFDANLQQVVTALHKYTGASVKISWNAVATACAQALHHLYRASDSPETLLAQANRLFEDVDTPIYGQLTFEVVRYQGMSGFFARRRGCCLAWRMPRANGYCSNCILTPRDQQDREFQEMLLAGK